MMYKLRIKFGLLILSMFHEKCNIMSKLHISFGQNITVSIKKAEVQVESHVSACLSLYCHEINVCIKSMIKELLRQLYVLHITSLGGSSTWGTDGHGCKGVGYPMLMPGPAWHAIKNYDGLGLKTSDRLRPRFPPAAGVPGGVVSRLAHRRRRVPFDWR